MHVMHCDAQPDNFSRGIIVTELQKSSSCQTSCDPGLARGYDSRFVNMSVTNSLIDTQLLEGAIIGGALLGTAFLVAHGIFGKSAKSAGGRIAKVAIELQRKSFHMVGGCIICGVYHWGIKLGYMTSAYAPDVPKLLSPPPPPPLGDDSAEGHLAAFLTRARQCRLVLPSEERAGASSSPSPL